MSLEQTYAPGSRVRVRGEEWAVEKSLAVSTGGYWSHALRVLSCGKYKLMAD